MFEIEKRIFSPAYREMVKILKKLGRDDVKDEEKLYDIRSSEGEGRKGPASRPASVPKSRHKRGDTREESRPIDWEEEKNRNA